MKRIRYGYIGTVTVKAPRKRGDRSEYPATVEVWHGTEIHEDSISACFEANRVRCTRFGEYGTLAAHCSRAVAR